MQKHYCCYFIRELKIIIYMIYTKSKIIPSCGVYRIKVLLCRLRGATARDP